MGVLPRCTHSAPAVRVVRAMMSPPSAPASDTISSALSDSADLTEGEVAGVAIGCIIVGVLLGFLSGRAVARPKFAVSTKTEMVIVTKA
jgi:hypothetical protein